MLGFMWDFSQQWNLQSEPLAVCFLNRMSGLGRANGEISKNMYPIYESVGEKNSWSENNFKSEFKMVVTVAFGSIVRTASFILYKVRT